MRSLRILRRTALIYPLLTLVRQGGGLSAMAGHGTEHPAAVSAVAARGAAAVAACFFCFLKEKHCRVMTNGIKYNCHH